MDIVLTEKLMARVLSEGLGFDLSDPNLKETPHRIAKMYCNEFFKNVGGEFTDWKSFPNDKNYNQIVVEDNIDFTSTCSHHFLPFMGRAWILYIPDKKLAGASKAARAVNHYARRPQLQENLTHEVLESFVNAIEPQGAMVVMTARHGCMQARGVEQKQAGMVTSALWGCFESDPSLELKGLELIKLSKV